jgi:hypothetical protein
MATSGSRVGLRSPGAEWSRASAARRRSAALAALAALLGLGCESTLTQVGRPLRVDRLETSLEPGKSTPEDVMRVLGPPSGTGRSELPIEPVPRPVWAYYFEKATSTGAATGSVGRSLLFVYFREGRYDGYLWFSSIAPRSGGP